MPLVALAISLLGILVLKGCQVPASPDPPAEHVQTVLRIPSRSSSASSVSSASLASFSSLSPLEGADTELPQSVLSSQEHGSGASLSEWLSDTGILSIGSPSAPLVLLQFTHHSCAYCATFQREQVPSLLSDFVERGLLRYDIALLPLQKYPESAEQASILLCAAKQGKGAAAHALLFEVGVTDGKTLLKGLRPLSLAEKAFQTCLDSPETKALLTRQAALAESLGVTHVPTFFLNGEKFLGLPRYPDLRGRIEEAKE